MKILIFGAGVLGSVYAAMLHKAGNEVSLLARGKRFADLCQYGIVLEDVSSGETYTSQVNVVEKLSSEDIYDLAIIIVRKNQLASVLPSLSANRNIPNILFLLNNAAGYQEMVKAVGYERVLLGFPGGGGERVGHIIRYRLASARTQPTTIGEIDGYPSVRIKTIALTFEQAGLPVHICNNMDAWLKTHVALVSPIANAIYLAGGDVYRLARTRDALILMVRAIREGLQVLDELKIPITPARYRLLKWIPEPLLITILQKRLPSPNAELVLQRHANAARDEMLMLSNEFQSLAHATFLPTPALDHLYQAVDPDFPAMPDGQKLLGMNWRSVWAGIGLALAGLIFLSWIIRRKK
ncbi:MAG TPA: 2-dehydropantoate 2-reductase N-terminal domain-containing protein [Anaerolineaceae bacterium]